MHSIQLTARAKGCLKTYAPIADHALHAQFQVVPAQEAAPQVIDITITAQEAFEGVIRAAMPVCPEETRFFLPGVIYGTNRGDAPLVVDSQAPRLRKGGSFPASPWWMFRADRLSHPCAFAYAGGRLAGFAASPTPAAGWRALRHRPIIYAKTASARPGRPV